MTVVPVKRFR